MTKRKEEVVNDPKIETLARRPDRVERENCILRWAVAGVLVLGMIAPAGAQEEGWILMLPPVVFEGEKPQAATDAPLSEWYPNETFETASACEAHKDKMTDEFEAVGKKMQDRRIHALLAKFVTARCVPASVVYPQVKEK
ncbi:MAG: hypothetical protein ACE5JQ_03130 [Candidatus Methylomirabilales bacterium]